MNLILHPRRVARDLARLVAAVAACMLAVGLWTAVSSRTTVSAAATDAGSPTIVDPATTQALVGGGSATPFALRLPVGAACTGDSSGGGYRVQTYLVPSTVSPASLRFGANGPTPAGVGTELAQPLFSVTDSAYVNGLTDIATSPGGPGTISGLPQFSFAVFGTDGAAVVPPGTYNLGVACTLGNELTADQVDRYWNVQITVTADGDDEPGGLAWAVAGGGGTTTTTTPTTTPSTSTTSTTSTPSSSTTSTAVPATSSTTSSTTSTSTAPTSTSTTEPGSPTTTSRPPGSVLAARLASDGPAGAVSAAGQLPYTGGTTISLVVWGVLLVLFGVVAVLLGRLPERRP